MRDENGDGITDETDQVVIVSGSEFAPGITPGRRVVVEAHGHSIFEGTTEDWTVVYRGDRWTEATMVAVDSLGDLARCEFDEWTTTAGQTAGPRITAALNRSDVQFPYRRSIGTGSSTLQADLVTWGSNVLNYLQLVARSDFGRLFADRTNTLTFQGRSELVNAETVITFSDATPDPNSLNPTIEFEAFELGSTSELLFTRVGVDREGGVLQTVNDTDAQGQYGVRALNVTGLLVDSDGQSRSMAEFLLSIYKEPQQRVAAIHVNVSQLEAVAAMRAVTCDIGRVVRFRCTPLGTGVEIDQTLVVDGVEHRIPVDGPHMMRLTVAPLHQTGVFTLDDPVLGLLDSGGHLGF